MTKNNAKQDGRRNNGGHSKVGRKPLNTRPIQPRPTLDTIDFIQNQVAAQSKTQGQIIDWMTDIARDYLKNNTQK